MALMKTDHTDEEGMGKKRTKPKVLIAQSTQFVRNAVLKKNTVMGQITENRQLIQNGKIIHRFPGGSAEPLMALMKTDHADVNGEKGLREENGALISFLHRCYQGL